MDSMIIWNTYNDIITKEDDHPMCLDDPMLLDGHVANAAAHESTGDPITPAARDAPLMTFNMKNVGNEQSVPSGLVSLGQAPPAVTAVATTTFRPPAVVDGNPVLTYIELPRNIAKMLFDLRAKDLLRGSL